ncbi:hypothetical protein Taro_023127 [Colocasia esculenta]|uniref:tryptophan synthase n=1 Tax=Colocasia esculenta TaxID=4460 RepID=A0A843VGG9_COLES|nr:hypothetical protein [Colocasia esculenta]
MCLSFFTSIPVAEELAIELLQAPVTISRKSSSLSQTCSHLKPSDLPYCLEVFNRMGLWSKVLLTTPTTPTQRMKAIVDASQGFVYLVSSSKKMQVSSVGVTGARASVSFRVQSLLQEIKEATTKPVAVGFGISNPEHVKQVARWGADGVIVGSAMVKILGDAKSPQEGLKELEKFTASLKAALP